MVKNLPAMQGTWVWSLGWENPLEKETATHSRILAWTIPWTEEDFKQLDMTERLTHFFFFNWFLESKTWENSRLWDSLLKCYEILFHIKSEGPQYLRVEGWTIRRFPAISSFPSPSTCQACAQLGNHSFIHLPSLNSWKSGSLDQVNSRYPNNEWPKSDCSGTITLKFSGNCL